MTNNTLKGEATYKNVRFTPKNAKEARSFAKFFQSKTA